VIVIGAGIVGAACANALSERGLRVTVIEQDIAGGGATAAGMGHLVVMDDNPAELALTAYSVSLWKDLVGERPQRHEYSGCGTIWVAADEEEMAGRAQRHRPCRPWPDCEVLSPAALYAREPQLRAGLAGGLLVPRRRPGLPAQATRILLDRAMRRGASRQARDRRPPSKTRRAAGRRHAAPGAHVVLANGIQARPRCCRNCRCSRRRATWPSPTAIPASCATSWWNWAISKAPTRPAATRSPSICSPVLPDKS
jgi:glycine/D-amino acid oxidase-like deaminating enzyme